MRPGTHLSGIKRMAASAALAFGVVALGGCLPDEPASEAAATAPASDPSLETNAKQDRTPSSTGVPKGCAREWSAAAMDSVLYCPDIPPPRPH
jgi:hypothetical protein